MQECPAEPGDGSGASAPRAGARIPDALNTPDETASGAGQASSMQRAARIEDMKSLRVSDSPCVAVCSTLYDEICRGCGRTAMEVANWVFLSDDEKREIWLRIRSQGYPRRTKR